MKSDIREYVYVAYPIWKFRVNHTTEQIFMGGKRVMIPYQLAARRIELGYWQEVDRRIDKTKRKRRGKR